MDTLLGKHWHHLPADEVIDLLDSDQGKGLDLFEVENRQEHFGPNAITEKKGKGPLLRFLLQLHQPLIYILIVAGTVSALLQHWVDAGVIFAVVLVNAFIGYIQEAKAVNAMEALARTMTTEATALRAGGEQRILSTEAVPGDIVLLKSGDKVPADLRLLRTRDLQVDESALTGESIPVEKRPDVLDHDTGLADRRNMAYASSLVTYGQGTGIVIGIGDQTEVGRISELISKTETLETPLTHKIAYFSRILLYAILSLAAVTFLVGLVRGQTVIDMFIAVVALAVGAIPEGLPAALTITLAIGVARLARKQAIIRKLAAVETLGSTTVICSDKTGTLTENQMTVQEIFAGGERFQVSGDGYSPSGQILKQEMAVDTSRSPALAECLKAGLLCNDSLLVKEEGRWAVRGDPTEGALLVSAAKAGMDMTAMKEEMPRIDAVPFESQHQYMATLHDAGADASGVIYIKGSVETILARCTASLDAAGRSTGLDAERVQEEVKRMAAGGMRLLAFARGETRPGAARLDHADVASGMIFLGIQGMIDPPRKEAITAVEKCHTAGIRVKLITGDHVLTASSIAQQVGIHDPLRVVDGKALAQTSDRELMEVAEKTDVFARVTPEQKLRLVKALQAGGNVVAMTGDGVNDAPALKRADIGVAMGITGTDVAKEAANMVLTDDNFASIEAAVEEGRGIFDNLSKFIVWTLPTNLGEGLVIMAAIFAGVALPILPTQILWINMTTAVLLGLMLAFEPKEPGIMTRPPRDPKTPILTRELIGRIAIVGALLLVGSFGLFEWELARGATEAEARTVAVNVFVMTEIFYLFNCRSLTKSMFRLGVFSNTWVLGGVAIMLVLQLLFTYLPAMHFLFQSASIGLDSWVRILAVSVTVSIVVGVEKWFRSKGEKRRAVRQT